MHRWRQRLHGEQKFSDRRMNYAHSLDQE